MSLKNLPLVFDDARMAFLHPFLVQNIPKDEELVEQIRKLGLGVKRESKEIKSFRIAEFSLSKEYIENILTFEISGFKMEVPGIGVTIPVKVFLRIQKSLKCCILYFTFKFPKSTTDDLIYLKQHTRMKVYIQSAPTSISNLMVSEEKHGLTLKDMFGKYRTLLSQVLELRFKSDFYEEFRSCIEIRELSDSINDPRKILEKYPTQMYGLLVSDEGWRFAPEDFAKKRIFESCWSSRNFYVVIGHASGTLNLNFRKSKTRKEYTNSQRWVRKKYNCPVEDYFTHDFEIAGAENGGLTIIELATIEACILSSLQTGKIPEKPMDIVEFRGNIVDGIEAMRHLKIPEVSVFAEKLRKEISIPRYEELMKKLGQIDRAIEIKFSEARHAQNAKMASRMQILSVIFSGAVGLSAAALMKSATIPGTDIVITGWIALTIGLVLWILITTLGIRVTRMILKKGGILR